MCTTKNRMSDHQVTNSIEDVCRLIQQVEEKDKIIEEKDTKIKELVATNTSWQDYNAKQEAYVKDLLQKLSELERRNASATSSSSSAGSSLSVAQQEKIDQIILEYKRKLDTMEQEKITISDENRELRRQMEQMKRQSQQQSDELRCSKDRLASLNSDKQHMQLQMTQYKEDFETERKDRQTAMSRLAEVEGQLTFANRQIQQHDIQQMESLAQRRAASLDYYRQEYERTHGPIQAVETDCNPEEGQDEIDGPAVPHPAVAQMSKRHLVPLSPRLAADGMDETDGGYDVVATSARRNGFREDDNNFDEVDGPVSNSINHSGLQCPCCMRHFSIDSHLELIEHLDTCK